MILRIVCGAVLFTALATPHLSAQTTEDAASRSSESNDSRPNVLMICIDDLNDWVEPLGGHPQVQTPAMKSLAARGVTFTNAHCQSPLCNPSRTSLMLSLRPSTTGVYGLSPWFRNLPKWQDRVSLPQHFQAHGYRTYSAGKVYHGGYGRNAKEFDEIGPPGVAGVKPPQKLIPSTPQGNHPLMDWGVFDHKDEDKGDHKVADWVTSKLSAMPEDEPFFMSCGFFLPHVPCHVTQKWWDLYDEATLQLPAFRRNDRLDCSPFSWYLHWKLPEPRLSWLDHHDQHKNLVHSYLACISFVDHQVGRVLAALEDSPHRHNTIICLWSDHGWHLGEKNLTGKNTLWERSTHVPLIFAGPNIAHGKTGSPAELLDIYPTLSELAGLTSRNDLEGISLVPQIRDLDAIRKRPAITDHNPGNQGIRGERYRLIRYADGSEELYDVLSDPNEYDNLIEEPQHAVAADRLRRHVNSDPAPLAPNSQHRVLEKKADGWYWEHQKIDPSRPPMSIAPNQPEDLLSITDSK
ncbi:sulfatase [Rhodopirellula sp. JC740]|uniref:Sulfatase n=1 Tax=Rhodopirellula halodulae TaxID=2894198 RepID=A0ABS8NFD2_9BACT|nr:sulfatase [Rhodopirellula sp. JC740]MCC9641548.1 sulfatase [Rhodopirellula sp. JC740]